MSMNNNTRTARNLTALALGALLAAAGTAVALPLGIQHSIDTPAGTAYAAADEQGADACLSNSVPQLPALPAVPSLPALPVPVPVAVPAVPDVYGSADTCAKAGLDGVSIDTGADAMGLHAGTDAGLDTSQEHQDVEETAGGALGFFQGIAHRIASWF